MRRLLILLLLALPVWAQEADGVDPESPDASSKEAAGPVEDAANERADDDEDSDELYAEEDDDAFIPSENVKFGQSIPFPTDI
jgi:hypothetical protein